MPNFLDKTGLTYLVDKLKKDLTDTLLKDVVLLRNEGGDDRILDDGDLGEFCYTNGQYIGLGGHSIYVGEELNFWSISFKKGDAPYPGDFNTFLHIGCGNSLSGTQRAYLVSMGIYGNSRDHFLYGVKEPTGKIAWQSVLAGTSDRAMDIVFDGANHPVILTQAKMYRLDPENFSWSKISILNYISKEIFEVLNASWVRAVSVDDSYVYKLRSIAAGYRKENNQLVLATCIDGVSKWEDNTNELKANSIDDLKCILPYEFDSIHKLLLANSTQAIIISDFLSASSSAKIVDLPKIGDKILNAAFGKETIIMTPSFGRTMLYSKDGGDTWGRSYLPVYTNWGEVLFADGKFVLFGRGSAPYVLTSEDGINWKKVTKPAFFNLSGENITDKVISESPLSNLATKTELEEKTNFDYGLLTATDLKEWATNTAKRSGSFCLNETTKNGIPEVLGPGHYIGEIIVSNGTKYIMVTTQNNAIMAYTTYYNNSWFSWQIVKT